MGKQDETFELRHTLNNLNLRYVIAMQIKAMRAARKWSTLELADRAGLKETDVIRAENPENENVSLLKLIQVANACDVGLLVRFVPFYLTAGIISPASFDDENKKKSGKLTP